MVDRIDLLEKIRKSNIKDDKVIKAMKEMKWAGVKILRDKEWKEVDVISRCDYNNSDEQDQLIERNDK